MAQKNKVTVGFLLGWVLGPLMFVAAVGSYGQYQNIVQSLAMSLLGVILLPPTWKFVEKKTGKEVSGGVRFVLVIAMLYAIFYIDKHQPKTSMEPVASISNCLNLMLFDWTSALNRACIDLRNRGIHVRNCRRVVIARSLGNVTNRAQTTLVRAMGETRATQTRPCPVDQKHPL